MAKTVNEAMTAIADSIRENAEKALGVNISGKLSLDEMPTAINKTCDGVYNMGAVIARDEDNGKVLRLANRLVDGEYERAVEIDSVVDSAISDFDGVKGAIKDYQVDVPSGTPTSEYGYLVKEACEKAAGATLEESFNMGVNAGREEVYEEIQQPLDSAIEKIQQYAYGGEGEPGSSAASRVSYVDNNIPNVYNSGFDDGKTSEREEFDKAMSGINLSLENTVNIVNEYIDSEEVPGTPWEKIEYLNTKVPSVYEAGSKNGLYAWWLKFQQSKESYGYRNAFWGAGWVDDIYNPVIDIVANSGKNHNEMFRGTGITDIKVAVDFKQSGSTYVFGSSYIKKIPHLKVIESVTYVNWFTGGTALEEITMSGVIGNDINFQDSPLNKASIQSVIGCLSSTASGKTSTFKKSAVESAFKTEEWNELIKRNLNWNFSLF